MIIHDVTLIGLRDAGLRVRRIRKQLLISRSEIRLTCRLQGCLHATSQQQAQQDARASTNCHSQALIRLIALKFRAPRLEAYQIAETPRDFQRYVSLTKLSLETVARISQFHDPHR